VKYFHEESTYLAEEKDLQSIIADCPKNQIIGDNLIRAWSKINDPNYNTILCSVSGGSDSDIVLDICEKVKNQNNIKYVWFDTGLEYQATKEHLKYLEDKYRIEIDTCKPVKSISKCCREYGQPFLSKQVSEFISRLQRHNFQWEDESFDCLVKKYPKCKSALQWWCCSKGSGSHFNITQNKYLKEFMIANPPQFKISNKCCYFAKKLVSKHVISDTNCDLSITGIRKAEGGARAGAYKSCFSSNEDIADEYRPIFWYKNSDKIDYENHYGIIHSKCYSQYGLKRTGCVGCPYSRNLEYELEVIQKYEPKLYKAVCNVFKDSYEYTRQYWKFCDEMSGKRVKNG
jgi:3'-phosphoadenosine 5'-phosphosulfate sulfotransferase (PAPS reductase)/FAD synthetase